MPLPEGYLPREGDVIVLHGRVKFDVEREQSYEDKDDVLYVHFRIFGDYANRRIPLSEVRGLFCRSRNVDDRVVAAKRPEFGVGTVLAVTEDGWCWVLFGADNRANPATYHANDLDAAPPEHGERNVVGIEPPCASPESYAEERARSVAFQDASDPGISAQNEETEF